MQLYKCWLKNVSCDYLYLLLRNYLHRTVESQHSNKEGRSLSAYKAAVVALAKEDQLTIIFIFMLLCLRINALF